MFALRCGRRAGRVVEHDGTSTSWPNVRRSLLAAAGLTKSRSLRVLRDQGTVPPLDGSPTSFRGDLVDLDCSMKRQIAWALDAEA